ncbi:uncharacterized protein MELLADRAFT_85444 [Melampsora larici-populina 98AG31]|uniref:Uncharacterized protein n=1 Tax=Melampsora larici-populina (strain 98AG31 / pathotype 3-4-7) TaxID=747676 RepID=F4RIQ4_MELLP|nr:uncharacterized protein MELLADRAFT_85444 [Melampsora larici-populina 98AG31]EGG07790.1 hypothetical protein MELLADRAFT_85444 [Melampsora larici-populina 98AG31]
MNQSNHDHNTLSSNTDLHSNGNSDNPPGRPSGPIASPHSEPIAVEKSDSLDKAVDLQLNHSSNNTFGYDSLQIEKSSQSRRELTCDTTTETNEEDPAFISAQLQCEISKAQQSLADYDSSDMEMEDKTSLSQNPSHNHLCMEARKDINNELQSESARHSNPNDPKNTIKESSQSASCTSSNPILPSTTTTSAEDPCILPIASSESTSDNREMLNSANSTNPDNIQNPIGGDSHFESPTPLNKFSLSTNAPIPDNSSDLSPISSQSTSGNEQINLNPRLDSTKNSNSPAFSENSAHLTVNSFRSAADEVSDVNGILTIEVHPLIDSSKGKSEEAQPQNSATSTVNSFQNAADEASDANGLPTIECHPVIDSSQEEAEESQPQPNRKQTLSSGISRPSKIVQSRVETSNGLIHTEDHHSDTKALRASTALPVYSKLIAALEEAKNSNCLTDPIEKDLENLTLRCKVTGNAIIQNKPLPPADKLWIIIDDEDEDLGAKYQFSLQPLDSKGRHSPEKSDCSPSTSDNILPIQMNNEVIKNLDLTKNRNALVEKTQVKTRKDSISKEEFMLSSKFSSDLDCEEQENHTKLAKSQQEIKQSENLASHSPRSQTSNDKLQAKVRIFAVSESISNVNSEEENPERERPARAPDSHQKIDQSQNGSTQSTESQARNETQRTRSHDQTPISNTPVCNPCAESEKSTDQIQSPVGQINLPVSVAHKKELRKRQATTVEGGSADLTDSDTSLVSTKKVTRKSKERNSGKVCSKEKVGEGEVTKQAVGMKRRKIVGGNESLVVFIFFIGSSQTEKELSQLLSPYGTHQTSRNSKLAAWDALNALLERRRVGEPLNQVFLDSIDGGTSNVVIRTEYNAQNWFEAINKEILNGNVVPQLFNCHKGEPAYAAGFFNTLFVKSESLTEKVPDNVPEVWHQTWRSMRMSLRPSPTRVSAFLKVLLDSVLLTGKTFLKNPPVSDQEKAMTGVQAVCQALKWLNSQKTSKGSKNKTIRLLDSDNADSLVDIGLIQQWQSLFIKVVESYVALYFEVNYILKEDASPDDKAVALKFKKDWKGNSIKSPTLSYLTMFACCGIRGLICCSGDVNVTPAGQMMSFAVLSEWMCKQRKDFKVIEPIFKRSNQTLMKLMDGLFDEESHFIMPEITWRLTYKRQ